MFVYNLFTHERIGGGAPTWAPRAANDITEQSGAAVVWVWPYLDADTFDFQVQNGKDITLANDKADLVPNRNTNIKLGPPVKLDPWIIQLTVRQTKDSHQGMMSIAMKDVDGDLLSRINPGDWVVCWMFDNNAGAERLRDKLKNFPNISSGLNGFDSGLKFMGKIFSARKNVQVNNFGGKNKIIQVLATSFSELDSNIYFDQQLSTNFFNGLEFMGTISEELGRDIHTPYDVNSGFAKLLATFMGIGLKGNSANSKAQMSKPLLIPSEMGRILGKTNVENYIDVLDTYIGIQKYSDYMPEGLGNTGTITLTKKQTEPSPAKSIVYTPQTLIGYVYPFIQPYNNVPMWGILKETVNDTVNEMYTVMRAGPDWSIQPTLMVRQIPFNTDDFSKYPDAPPHTTFRSLPRWLATDEIVTGYSIGKSESLRINFVRIQGAGVLNPAAVQNAARALVNPVADAVDIQRNGLRGFLTSINSTYGEDAIASTKEWTALVTDRTMGSHLKLSGSIQLAGVQEPIAVGDNLEYDGFVYHIEMVEHSLNIDGMTGRKSYSTNLAISNGVPAKGPPLPGIVTRDTLQTPGVYQVPVQTSVGVGTIDVYGLAGSLAGTSQPAVVGNTQEVPTNFKKDN